MSQFVTHSLVHMDNSAFLLFLLVLGCVWTFPSTSQGSDREVHMENESSVGHEHLECDPGVGT